ncbi:MAG: methyltransferase domain-containing protein [Candidatus Omnitrophota bacterium]
MPNEVMNEDKLKEFYDGVYATGDIRDNTKLYAWIMRLLRPLQGSKFLDVGCGGGWLLREAERCGLKTFGLDISSEAVKRAKKIAPYSEIISADGENLPWPDGYFDYAASLGCLEHYIDPDKGAAEICRVLKPDAKAIIILPNRYQLGDILKALFTGKGNEEWQAIERDAAKEQWREFLERNGLRVLKIFKYNKYPEFFQEGTFKVKSIRKFVITTLIRYLAPFNLAQQFVYLCEKKG